MRTGLVLGLVAGAFLARESIERHPPAFRVCAVGGLALVIAIAAAIPLRGIADVRPEMHRLVAIEDRTAHQYDTAANQFRLGAIKAKELAQLIDQSIRPELHKARAHGGCSKLAHQPWGYQEEDDTNGQKAPRGSQ